MPCHQLLTENDRNPALKVAKWAAPALKVSPGISKGLSQAGCQYFQGVYTSKLPARRWLFGVAILQKDGREFLPHVFFIFPTSVLAYKSRFHVILSFVFPTVVLSLFPEESHITDIYCFRRKGNRGREVLTLAADRSHYFLAFPLTASLGAPQTELIQSVPRPRAASTSLSCSGPRKGPAEPDSCLADKSPGPGAWQHSRTHLPHLLCSWGLWHLMCTDGKMLHYPFFGKGN